MLIFIAIEMGCCSSSVDTTFYSDMVSQYIRTDVHIRIDRDGKIDLTTQLKNERIEIICMGCLEHMMSDIEILFRDQKLPGTNYRPDLIFRRNNKVYYIEIDENKHQSYDKSKEETRLNTIRDYCLTNYHSFKLIRFNPNEYVTSNSDTSKNKYNAAMSFYHLINAIDGLTTFESLSL